jgi:hypothetical protein|tara:strand:+ start:48 stop:269 length:222 start_codon:yes stop_codon:yes gene_type:complete
MQATKDQLNQGCEKVLKALKENPSGVTAGDFDNGFALRSRISNLRDMGLNIITEYERNSTNTGSHGRYRLILN